MMSTDAESNASSARLEDLVAQLCPYWEEVPQLTTREEWLKELIGTFHVTGYWSSKADEAIDFGVWDVESSEEAAACALDRISEVSDWSHEEFDGNLPEQELSELAQLLARSDLVVQRVTAEGGMKFCGTIRQGFLRVRYRGDKSGRAVCIRPSDYLWRTEGDRTFGPMWESSDGYPE